MANYRAGDVIRLTRQAVGMTQEMLCENICSVETLSRIENGKHKVKRDTYRRLMERMERIPEKNYAICTGKYMELLEEKIDFEDAVSKFDYEKAEICLQGLKQKIGEGILNKQYIAKAEALVHHRNKQIDEDQMISRLQEAIRMTLPGYGQYLDGEYPYTEQEVLTLMNLAGAYRVKKRYENGIRIYRALLNSLHLGYMTQHDSIILEIKVMRNMALIFGEMEQYQEAIVLLKKVIQLSKEMDYGQMISTAFSQIAWNMMHQIENGERDMSDIVRVKAYTRQAYYIAAARDDYIHAAKIREYYENKFEEAIELNVCINKVEVVSKRNNAGIARQSGI